MATTQGCFNVDPDITGIGVRINLYATTLLIATIPRTPLTLPLLEVLVTNGAISGFALLVTAIVRTAQHKLTLYHAIFILHMLAFLGIGAFPVGHYRPTTLRSLLTIFISVCIVLTFHGWAIYVWATAPTFGPEDTVKCNDQTKYIFMFVSVRATVTWLRVLWMVVLAMGAFGALIYLLFLFGLLALGGQGQDRARARNIEQMSQLRLKNALLFLSAIYAVVMLELYVKRNKHLEIPDQDELWPFGQILALVMVVSTFNEIIHFLLGLLPQKASRSVSQADEEISL